MFNTYYENELQKLREQATEFAKAHPIAAPLLIGSSMDPGAERMLEGVAFLSGLLHQKLDNEYHQFIKETIEIINPSFIRPLPSVSMVLFEHKSGYRETTVVKAGAVLSSDKIDGTACQFQTLFDIEVNPVRVISTQASQVSEKKTQIQVTLELTGSDLNRWRPQKGLYFFLGGTYTQTTKIFMLLHHYLKKIILKSENTDKEFILEKNDLKAIGLNLANPLLDYPVQSLTAFSLLQEYFILPQKLTLMALTGLNKWHERSGNRFSIYFEFSDIPEPIPRLNNDTFIFNTVPVVNLFTYEMEPVSLDHKTDKIVLRPNTKHSNHYQVYDVESIIGYRTGTADKKEYSSMSSFKAIKDKQSLYQLNRNRSIINNAPEATLFFPYRDDLNKLATETLSITLKCTNGRLPEKLKVGDICRPTFNSPEFLTFRNIVQPSYSIEAPSDVKNLWRFITHLSMNFLSITELKNLKELLSLYISPEDQDKSRLAANRKRLDGIIALKSTSVDKVSHGAMTRGLKIEMEVNATQFAGLGDVYLFGTMMDNFFSVYTSINTFTQFNLKEINAGVTFKWAARIGNRILL